MAEDLATLRRSIHNKKSPTLRFLPEITAQNIYNKIPTDYVHGLVEKKRLQRNEEVYAVAQKIHRKMHNIVQIQDCNKQESTLHITVNLLRNYNTGRHGGWDNYGSLKGSKKGTYVKARNTQNTSEFG